MAGPPPSARGASRQPLASRHSVPGWLPHWLATATLTPTHSLLQVYELRLEAVLAELALMKAQCGTDYSLTLTSPQHRLEVLTSSACWRGEGRQGGVEVATHGCVLPWQAGA